MVVYLRDGRICSGKCTCCHTEIEVADQTFYLTRSQYTDTGPTSSGADPITPGAWQGSHWNANFLSHRYDATRKNSGASGIRTPDLALPRRTRDLKENVTGNQFCWGFFQAAHTTKLSDLRKGSTDRVKQTPWVQHTLGTTYVRHRKAVLLGFLPGSTHHKAE